GVLKWYEGRSTGVAHYAPLIFVPVEMKKRQNGFSVKKIEEDTLFNVTLIEKLRQEYEISIPNLDPLPSDDSGVNVDMILQTVRRAVDGMEGWDVLQGASLGVFSFNQFVMWRDLEDHMDVLGKGPIVSSLIEGVPYPSDEGMDFSSDPYGLCLTVAADGSQIKAVRASGEGRSFIMHGPPGTGKSQTITNMICNALYHGRTVLFVAEKRAALEVVEKRLDEVGIGNRCLELHSNKTEKGRVVDQLKKALEPSRSYDQEEERKLLRSIENIRDKLDVYVSELYKPRSFGTNAFDCISGYDEHNVVGVSDMQVDAGMEDVVKVDSMFDIETAIRSACQAFRMVKDMDREALGAVALSELRASIGSEVQQKVSVLRRASEDAVSTRAALISKGVPVDVRDAEALKAFFDRVTGLEPGVVEDSDLDTLPSRLADVADTAMNVSGQLQAAGSKGIGVHSDELGQLRDSAARLRSAVARVDEKHLGLDRAMLRDLCDDCDRYLDVMFSMETDRSAVLRVWTPDIFDRHDGFDPSKEWAAANSTGFFGKNKARKAFMDRAASSLRNPGMRFEDLASTVNLISTTISSYSRVSSIPGKYPRESVAQVSDRLSERAVRCRNGIEAARSIGVDPAYMPSIIRKAKDAEDEYQLYIDKYATWEAVNGAFAESMKVREPLDDPEKSLELCDRISPHIGDMFDWANWNACVERLRSYKVSAAVGLIETSMETDMVIHAVFRSIYRQFIQVCRQQSEVLRVFDSRSFEDMVERFKVLDQQHTSYNRAALALTLSQRIPKNMDTSVSGSEISVLYKAVNSSRMRKSIRNLLQEIPNVLPRICPCFLMSPQSVAQYLTMDYPLFDLVIFDESSQITTGKAVGALGRAKAAVIAGDSKQLPPTTFFQKRIEATEDEDDDMMDVDSFLDDCLALHMPETYLEWHYRSRHESLIAFSNRMFYDGKMLTFPSPNYMETRVSLRPVEGTYELGRRYNRKEAAAVVDEIRRRATDPVLCKQSIGVVAFSISQ
ncbi:MAG: DUF4011 domain-containing protein, partial [Candidatus Methanomethylophilaceae archaeon]|nr:DUF4011 domain-containing protein [Candidatus Methanomethylophilaceae archaeon]